MISKHTRTRVSNLMRRDLKKTPQYNEAKQRAFKGKTVYHCVECDINFYTGASDKNFQKLKEEEYPNLEKCRDRDFNMDHVNPVTPYDRDFHDMSLDEIAERVYCEADNLNYICKECHKVKTKKEARIRKLLRDERKDV